ncbi:uncharacterized protein G6M90_00g046370 [Metarhizium brunneum]|uniref:Rhodopsin domain-containing protein n=1 Tax=Metarhizium brunneum TaxID=500148 RepID=A0A7D5UWC6_9HYPO
MGELEGSHVPGVPQYEPREQRKWLVLVVAWMTTLAALAVMARLWCRRIRNQPFWWDDYLIMFSTIWNWAVVGVGFAMFIEGVGYHADEVGERAVANISMWLLVTEIIYVWNLCWTKLGLLCMYYRIFRFPLFKRQVVAVGGFVVLWAVCVSFLFTFICVPVEKLWRPAVEGRCVSELGVWLANASSTIFSDVVILLLPIPQVWRLQLKTLEKVGLTLVFGLGFFAVFASSFRTWVLFNYSKHDISYTLAPLLAWSDIEMSAGIISACLPTMRPLVRLVTARLGLASIFRLSRFTRSWADGSREESDTAGGKTSKESQSRGEVVGLPSFVTPQSLRVTAEPTRRRDRNSAFYRLPDDTPSGRFGGILVETSLEWGLESEGKAAPGAEVTEVQAPTRNLTAYDSSSSIEMMDGLSAATSKSEIPIRRCQ